MSPNISSSSSSSSSSLLASLIAIPPNSSSSCTPIRAPLPAAGDGVAVVSKCTVFPDRKSDVGELRLSVSDLPMLSCHYIQKGLFFPPPPFPVADLASRLTSSLSRSLSLFPALAGRLCTLPDGRIVVSCNDAGAEFFWASSDSFSLSDLLVPSSDVPAAVKLLFPLDGAISFQGHFRPLAAFQLTELADGAVFLGAAVNHAVVDGTSLWNFFNSWADLCRGGAPSPPDLRRNYFADSKAVLSFPGGRGPEVTFSVDAPFRERIFHFSREAILELKSRVNRDGPTDEICGKQIHDPKTAAVAAANQQGEEISSFQSLCALVWRSVTRARARLPADATTTFRMAVNCRHRVEPRVSANYFGNAIQSIATTAMVGEVAGRRDLSWASGLLHRSVAGHGDEAVRGMVAAWEAAPRCFPLGNPDGAGITMGSGHRFPIYEGNDFGWGKPAAVRSGKANKYDGKMSAFPGREGAGSVDLEMCLAPETMAALLCDDEFMSSVSQ